MPCVYTLQKPMVVAIAADKYFATHKPTHPFGDPVNLPGVLAPAYGQDITSAIGRKAPGPSGEYDQGKTVAALEPKMRKLLKVFAGDDKSGMATRLFNAFLRKQSAVAYFDDRDLNKAALWHENMRDFCKFALSAPNMVPTPGGRTRIHQALKNAGWNINKILIPTDLGVPAFNRGATFPQWGDYVNGLGVMINGVQYVYCVARHYCYDGTTYTIGIRYIFYDVFGLDDDDLIQYGDYFGADASVGIVAWWQLQHQHAYAPLVTRIMIDRNFKVPAV